MLRVICALTLTFFLVPSLARAGDPEPDCCPCASKYCNQENCDCYYSPLFILDGGWRNFLSSPSDGVCFDLIPDEPGCEQVSWANDPGAGGLLVLPDNGAVTSYLQVFSDGTPQSGDVDSWSAWGALASWDEKENGGNGDGIIDAGDLVFGGLAVWTDTNRDGIGTQEEMQYLWQGDWIALFPIDFGKRDQFGNLFSDRSRGVIFGRRDFTWDVFLKFEPGQRQEGGAR